MARLGWKPATWPACLLSGVTPAGRFEGSRKNPSVGSTGLENVSPPSRETAIRPARGREPRIHATYTTSPALFLVSTARSVITLRSRASPTLPRASLTTALVQDAPWSVERDTTTLIFGRSPMLDA